MPLSSRTPPTSSGAGATVLSKPATVFFRDTPLQQWEDVGSPRTEDAEAEYNRRIISNLQRARDVPVLQKLHLDRPTDKTQTTLEEKLLQGERIVKRLGSSVKEASVDMVMQPLAMTKVGFKGLATGITKDEVKSFASGALSEMADRMHYYSWKGTQDFQGTGPTRIMSQISSGLRGKVEPEPTLGGLLGGKRREEAFKMAAASAEEKLKVWSDAVDGPNKGLVTSVAKGLGSTAPSFVVGLGAMSLGKNLLSVTPNIARWLGGSFYAYLEATSQAGGVHREAKRQAIEDMGMPEEEAEREASLAATRTFGNNMILLVLTNRFGGLFSDKIFKGPVMNKLSTATTESIQEVIQRVDENVQLKRRFDEGLEETALVSWIIGGLLSFGGGGGGQIQQKTSTAEEKGPVEEPDGGGSMEQRVNRIINQNPARIRELTMLNLQQMQREGIIGENRLIGLKSGTSQDGLSPLEKEATKYKSAEEFVTAQGKPVYHGTDAKFDSFSNDMRGSITGAQSAKQAIWFTDDPDVAKAYSIYAAESGPLNKLMEEEKRLERIAQKSGLKEDWAVHDKLVQEIDDLGSYEETFSRREKANVKEAFVKGDFYIVDAKGKTPQELSADGDIDSWLSQQLDKGRSMGKDGVMFKNLDDAVGLYDRPATHYAIFDSKSVKTSKELVELYNQKKKAIGGEKKTGESRLIGLKDGEDAKLRQEMKNLIEPFRSIQKENQSMKGKDYQSGRSFGQDIRKLERLGAFKFQKRLVEDLDHSEAAMKFLEEAMEKKRGTVIGERIQKVIDDKRVTQVENETEEIFNEGLVDGVQSRAEGGASYLQDLDDMVKEGYISLDDVVDEGGTTLRELKDEYEAILDRTAEKRENTSAVKEKKQQSRREDTQKADKNGSGRLRGLKEGLEGEKETKAPQTQETPKKGKLSSRIREEAEGGKKKVRRFFKQVEKSDLTAEPVREAFKESPLREYDPVRNPETLRQARARIKELGVERAEVSVRNQARPDNVDNAVAMELAREWQNEAMKEKESGDTGKSEELYDRAISLLEDIGVKATVGGRATQALSMWSTLTPEGALRKAQRDIQKFNEQNIPRKKRKATELSREVVKKMQRVNEEALDEVVEALPGERTTTKAPAPMKRVEDMTEQEQTEAKGPDELAKRIVSYLSDPKPEKPDHLRDMVLTLFEVAKETLPERGRAVPRDPMDFLVEAISKRMQYTEVWDTAKGRVEEMLENKYEGEPGRAEEILENIETYIERPLRSPFAQKHVVKALENEIKARTVDIGQVVREHYSKVHATGEELRSSLISRSRLSPQEASDLSITIQRKFYELTTKKKEAILNSALKPRQVREQKDNIQRLIELSNLGAFDNNRFRTLTAEKLKLPTITPEIANDITRLANEVQELPNGEERNRAAAKLELYVEELTPPGIGRQLSTIQTIFMLLNPKTAIRNLGNIFLAPGRGAANLVAVPIDKGISFVFRSPRTKTLAPWFRGDVTTGLRGLFRGGKKGIVEARMGIDTRGVSLRYGEGVENNLKLGHQRRRVFKNPIMRSLETALRVELQVPDSAFFWRAFDLEAAHQKAIYELNHPGEKLEIPTNDMMEIMLHEGRRGIFEGDSALREFSVGIKRLLNFNKSFGLGDFVHKFPGIPANIVQEVINFSPLGALRTINEMANPLFGREFDQRKFSESLSEAVVGTTGYIFTGWFLYSLGILLGAPPDDREIGAVQKSMGLGNYLINVSALKRYVTSFFDADAAKRREGDYLVSYDWAQPVGAALSMGATIGKIREEKRLGGGSAAGLELLSTFLASMEGAVQTIEEQPLLRGIRQFMQGYGNTLERLTAVLKDAPATFVPSFLNQISQFTDNVSRNAYDPNPLKEAYNRVINKVPGLRATLPPNVDSTSGKVLQRYRADTNSFFNVFFNPAFVSRYKEDPVLREVLGLFERSGQVTQAPRFAPKKITIEGEDIVLNARQIAQYQQYIAMATYDFYETLINSSAWKEYSDEQRAEEMSKILTGAGMAARVELFGRTEKGLTSTAKQILEYNGFYD